LYDSAAIQNARGAAPRARHHDGAAEITLDDTRRARKTAAIPGRPRATLGTPNPSRPRVPTRRSTTRTRSRGGSGARHQIGGGPECGRALRPGRGQRDARARKTTGPRTNQLMSHAPRACPVPDGRSSENFGGRKGLPIHTARNRQSHRGCRRFLDSTASLGREPAATAIR